MKRLSLVFVVLGLCFVPTAQAVNPWPIVAGVVGGTALLSGMPSTEIQQTYYLGVFDPQEQLPLTIYRVRVHGEASLGSAKFASGWVPASLIDTLGSNVGINPESGKVEMTAAAQASAFKIGRRLMQFGPEGFRETPANHRLVIVMGSDPSGFFSAIDQSLGTIAAASQAGRSADLERLLYKAMVQLVDERRDLEKLIGDVNDDMPEAK